MLQRFVEQRLEEIGDAGLLRRIRQFDSVGVKTITDGKECISFATNNYLGLARSPRVRSAASSAARKYGAGSGASRLVAGTFEIHTKLEKAIANLKHRTRACVFPCGYMANIGTIASIFAKGDAIISDRSNHASIIDGCRLSGAKIFTYSHCNPDSLRTVLRRIRGKFNKVLIVTETVFSVGGEIAPLDAIVKSAREYRATAMLDDAHATGILGANGRGGEEHFGIEGEFDIVMGGLGKALGAQGGFIAGDEGLVNYLINTARTFIYTTALSPPAAAGALAAIEALREERWRRTKLFANVRRLGELLMGRGLVQKPPCTPIVPIVIGSEKKAIEVQARLMRKGIFVPALRYPTVPRGEAALRVSLSTLHSYSDIERFVDTLWALLEAAA